MRRRGRPKHPDILTPREWEVLALLREGCTNEQIAERLGIALSTARFHVSEILGKLGVTSRGEAARGQPEAAPSSVRGHALVPPFAFVRRLGRLGAGAQVVAGGVLAVVAVGVVLLAWCVMRSSGDSGAAVREWVANNSLTTPIRCTPSAQAASGLEVGSQPVFWRFGLTQQDLTSGQYCRRGFKIVLRVTNGVTCIDNKPPPGMMLDATSAATGARLTEPLTCVTTANDLPGAYFVTSFELPSPGVWRLRLVAGADASTQTIRVAGPPVTPPRVLADPAALAAINEDSGAIDVLDPSTLRPLAQIIAGYRPWVAVRQSARQLLVAQAFGPARDVTTPTLRVYDLRNLSAIPSVIAMPDRVIESVYAPSMVLSDDERYLYYGAVTMPSTGCTGGATLCQRASVGIIELEQSRVIAQASLPAGCVYPLVRRAPEYNAALALCATALDVELTVVSPDGSTEAAGAFALRIRSGGSPAREVDAGKDASGNYYVVYADGVVARAGTSDVALAGSDTISVSGAEEMPGGQRLLTYSNDRTTDVAGVIIYDPSDPSKFRRFPLGRAWSGSAPLSASKVALLSGWQVGVLDLTNGRVTTQAVTLDGSPEFLASG